ncbi:MAG: S41 family peptidase [Candidatus Omnitrophica bacterium]|nr:S41 family peptidase [Candidatus Omnitrophota bacterium]
MNSSVARRIWIGLLVVMVGLLACNVSPTQSAPKKERSDSIYEDLELLTDAISIVQAEYVDETKSKDLIYGALEGMLDHLDPNSSFLNPDAYKEMRLETEGEFGGLGIEIAVRDELLTIISPIDDTPAAKAGLKAGDRIVKINNELTRGLTLQNAVKKLRGKPGSQVALTVLREGEKKLLDYNLTRDVIKIQSVKDTKIIEDHIGYVRIASFQEHTPDDLEQALQRLTQEQMQGLILDLRNNPGGLLDVAVAVSEKFLAPKTLVVSTRGRRGNQNMEFRARGSRHYLNVPLVVMLNEGSASASEIVAGAVQDHHRGVLVGTKSFGKGSVQTVIPMKDGSALRLTTSKYYTPSGRSIHGLGIVPDVVVEEMPALVQMANVPNATELFEKIEKNTLEPDKLPSPDKDKAAAPKPYDMQLARAIDLIKGIRVYQKAPAATSTE